MDHETACHLSEWKNDRPISMCGPIASPQFQIGLGNYQIAHAQHLKTNY